MEVRRGEAGRHQRQPASHLTVRGCDQNRSADQARRPQRVCRAAAMQTRHYERESRSSWKEMRRVAQRGEGGGGALEEEIGIEG